MRTRTRLTLVAGLQGLAFQRVRYLNSPAFGLSVAFNSLRHAILLLGYLHLRRWLAEMRTTP